MLPEEASIEPCLTTCCKASKLEMPRPTDSPKINFVIQGAKYQNYTPKTWLRWMIPPMVAHPEKIDFRRFV